MELIAEIKGVKSANAKSVTKVYEDIIAKLGDVHIEPGYDGVFGVVKVYGEDEKQNINVSGQSKLL